jgi:hypothetical protein
MEKVKAVLEYLGGSRDGPPPPSVAWMQSPLWWGIWWAILIIVVVAFSGQSSKFIYIDF